MTMSLPMQTAAVEAAIKEGKNLDKISEEHPELADGVKAVRDEQERKQAPKRKGSGSMQAVYLTPPRI